MVLHHCHRMFHFVILASLLLLSTTLLALRSQVTTFATSYMGQIVTLQQSDFRVSVEMPSEPTSNRILLASEVASMSIAIIALTFAAMAWPARYIVGRTNKVILNRCWLYVQVNQIPPCRFYPLVLFLNCALAAVALALAFVQHDASQRLKNAISLQIASAIKNNVDSVLLNYQRFDIEAYACALSRYQAAGSHDTCNIEFARRWILLLLLGFTFSSVVTGIWALCEDTRVVVATKLEREQVNGLCIGFGEENVLNIIRPRSRSGESFRSTKEPLLIPRLSSSGLVKYFL